MSVHDLWLMWNDVSEDTTASVWVERDTKIATGKFNDIAWDARYRDRKVKIFGGLLPFGMLLPGEMPITQGNCFNSVLIIVEREEITK